LIVFGLGCPAVPAAVEPVGVGGGELPGAVDEVLDDHELVVGVGSQEVVSAADKVAEEFLAPGGGDFGDLHDLAPPVAGIGLAADVAGRITILACTAVLGISLVYDVTLIAIAQSATLGGPQTTTAVVAYGLFAAVEHVFLIAPPLLLPLA
jgi:hypothetical protein